MFGAFLYRGVRGLVPHDDRLGRARCLRRQPRYMRQLRGRGLEDYFLPLYMARILDYSRW